MRTTYDPVSADRTQLLIVGAGPVGLFAGLCAAQRGVDVMLLEQSFNRGHAAVLHPSSVRLLEGLGLGAELLAAGRKLNRVDVYLANSLATTIELPQSALTIPQSVLEEILLTGLRREGVEFKSPCQATALEEHSDRVRIHAVRRQPVAMTSPAT
ncbi:MAG: FAD-dependent monooxygenase, partial [Polyangiaceae bacterium]